MRIAFSGTDYCGQYSSAPSPHEVMWLPFAPTVAEMFRAAGRTPAWADVFVVVLAETSPVPLDLESCPCPTAAIVVDWQQWGDALLAHAPAFDMILADRSAVDALGRVFPGKVHTFCPMWNFAGIAPKRNPIPFEARPHDVVFVGRFLPTEQYKGRNKALSWLCQLSESIDVRILAGLSDDEYTEALCSAKIVLNHAAWSVQQGVNARYFEASACRTLLLGEFDNASLRAFFDADEILFYTEQTLALVINEALRNPEKAPGMIERCARKTELPVMVRLLPLLQSLVALGARTRTQRTLHDRIIGLCCGFGNWGGSTGRDPTATKTLLQVAQQALSEGGDDATLLNLAGVALAEVAEDLKRHGSARSAEGIWRSAQLSPVSLWMRARRLDPGFASPSYNLGRYYIHRQSLSRAATWLAQARSTITQHGPEAMARPTMLFPVRADSGTGLDRTHIFHANAALFEYSNEDERRRREADLLLWRTEELLGDLAANRGDVQTALAHFKSATRACPDLCTEAMRKMLEIANGDGGAAIECLETIVRINPLDLPHREQLHALYEERGQLAPALDEEIRLLRHAIPRPESFRRPPVERL